MSQELVDALAREIADLRADLPGASASAPQWAAWYLRQANILDEIANADPSQAESALHQAAVARERARTVAGQDTREGR